VLGPCRRGAVGNLWGDTRTTLTVMLSNKDLSIGFNCSSNPSSHVSIGVCSSDSEAFVRMGKDKPLGQERFFPTLQRFHLISKARITDQTTSAKAARSNAYENPPHSLVPSRRPMEASSR